MLVLLGAIGAAYGIVLQRSGFCFARVGYDLFLLRRRDALNGILAGLLTATAGFAVVSVLRTRAGLSAADHLLILDFGPGTLIGAVLFGLGMTLAGMCAAGTLLRLGEGYVVAWVTLAGFITGAALDPLRSLLPPAWQTPYRGLWLAVPLGATGGALVTLGLLSVLWVALNRGPRPLDAGPATGGGGGRISAVVAGGIALGLLNTLQVAAAMPWTVGGPLALVPGALTGGGTRAGLAPFVPLIVVNVGLVVGAMVCRGLRERRWGLRWPRRREQVLAALLGGLVMGWGLQLAHGCSIGGVFSAIPSLSLSGWLFLPALVVGMWAGAGIVRRLG